MTDDELNALVLRTSNLLGEREPSEDVRRAAEAYMAQGIRLGLHDADWLAQRCREIMRIGSPNRNQPADEESE